MVAQFIDGDPAKDTDSNFFFICIESKRSRFESWGLHQIFAALADVVIAPVWSTEERGSIPRGGTKLRMLTAKIYTLDF